MHRVLISILIALLAVNISVANADTPTFEEYPVLPIDMPKHKLRPKHGGELFAGRYEVFQDTGPGSPSSIGYMKDLVTGEEFQLPFTHYGLTFRADSRLAIANFGLTEFEKELCGGCGAVYMKWHPGEKEFVLIPLELVNSPYETDECDEPNWQCE